VSQETEAKIPWRADDERGLIDADGLIIDVAFEKRRIAACINACAGIDTETLEKHGVGGMAALEAEARSLNDLFDLRHKADARAIKQWQEVTGRTMEMPDQVDLCVFLMMALDIANVENAKLLEALTAIVNGDDMPSLNSFALGYGVEDRGLQGQHYAAAEFGWEEASERVHAWAINIADAALSTITKESA